MVTVRSMTRITQLARSGMMLALVILLPACSFGEHAKTRFAWGPVSEDLSPMPALKSTYAPKSRAAALRDETLAFNSNAPSAKDWVMRKGPDKGPTIFGAALKLDLSKGGWSMNLGAVRRGSNKTYGPQLIMGFDRL